MGAATGAVWPFSDIAAPAAASGPKTASGPNWRQGSDGRFLEDESKAVAALAAYDPAMRSIEWQGMNPHYRPGASDPWAIYNHLMAKNA